MSLRLSYMTCSQQCTLHLREAHKAVSLGEDNNTPERAAKMRWMVRYKEAASIIL